MSASDREEQEGRADGERRKRVAAWRVARKRRALTRRVQREFLDFLKSHQTGTVDDIRHRVEVPPESGTSFWGSAVLVLSQARLIRRLEFVVSNRPSRHGCRIGEWCLAVDGPTVDHWLATHPDLPDLEPGDDDGEDLAGSPAGKPSPPPAPPRSASAQQPSLFD